jgi:hypothetical protein
MKQLHAIRPLSLLGVLSLSAAMLVAQATVPNRALLLEMAANSKRLTHYEWKQRVTVVHRGKPAEPIISKVSFDGAGQMQRTTISAPQAKQMSGFRGRIAGQVQEKVKEDVKNIMQLAGEYNKPQQMAQAIRKATITPEGNSTLRVQAAGIINPQDSMTMLVDSGSHLAKHVDINTMYEGAPMTIAQDYGPVPDGPNAMKQMRVAVPNKELAVNVDSYDFAQNTSARR